MISDLKQTFASIGAKIILPYIVLTLIVVAIGAYIVTALVVGSTQERIENQLIVAGKAASEQIVQDEVERLRILQAIALGQGIAEALADGNAEVLRQDVPLIAFSQGATAVSILDRQGIQVMGWQRTNALETIITDTIDFSEQPDVAMVLAGVEDTTGSKRTFLVRQESKLMLFTAGPVILDNEIVGAVLVGAPLTEIAVNLAENSGAYITFYDTEGNALATSLAGDLNITLTALDGSPEQYEAVLELLRLSSQVTSVFVPTEDDQSILSRVKVLDQEYVVAFGEWRLRSKSFGLFSVALPADFIILTATTNRNLFTALFFVMTLAVFIIGFVLAGRITKPLKRLVDVSTAVAQGDLEQRTNIEQQDEIGVLANSFDIMTKNLAQRNRELVEQKVELEAILNSIADAVIVFNNNNEIVASNPAADKLLDHITYHNDTPATYLQSSKSTIQSGLNVNTLMALDTTDVAPARFRVGSRVFGISASPFRTPDGSDLGRVIVLRDETRQVESEQLKDGFITSISHELRTPLTSMKGYIHLLGSKKTDNLTDQQKQFVGIIQNSTELLVTHVNKLIDITSIQEGSLQLKKKRLSLNDIVHHKVDEWRDEMESKGLSLDAEVTPEPLWVMVDRTRLEWAIDNILRNANCYTVEGGKVMVCLFQKNGRASLQIRDTGVGISAVDQPYIFTRFYRAQNKLTLQKPGLGIELFVAKSIVDAHNGRIWVESELGTGSTFGIELMLTD